ncbi:MAG: aldo/keto reductase [Acholeplasmatales bacterium]|nr:aldo/keto reductase [Acholeplasmatales bacterium]
MKNLPKICLGAWAWGNDGTFGNHLTKEMLKPVFEKGIELGLNLWDTAFVYGMGESEKILGNFLKNIKREDYIISAKFTPQCAGMFGADPIRGMFETSNKLLNTNGIMDFYWIHNPVGAPRWIKEIIPLAKEGKIKNIGVSNHSLAEIKEANEILKKEGLKIDAVQNHYSIINRSSETSGILDYCKKNNIIFFSYMVVEQGALTGVYNENNPFPTDSDRGMKYNPLLPKLKIMNEALEKVGKNHNATISEVAIAYVINKGTLPIVGVTKIKHVEEAYISSKIILSSDEIKYLEDVAAKLNLNTIREWEKEMK